MNTTYQETSKKYSGNSLVCDGGVYVYKDQVIDGQGQQQEKAEDVRPDVHGLVCPPEYAARIHVPFRHKPMLGV